MAQTLKIIAVDNSHASLLTRLTFTFWSWWALCLFAAMARTTNQMHTLTVAFRTTAMTCVLVGALALGEVLHWQDLVAVSLIVGAIASVLWPSSR
jgi:drug/metabolite transporter (DMT)-like permease